MWRDAGTAQFGDLPGRVALTREEAAWLLALDGLRTHETAVESHDCATRLLRQATSAGALEDAAQSPPAARLASRQEREISWARAHAVAHPELAVDLTARDRARIRVVGEGQLGTAVVGLLEDAGLRACPDPMHVGGTAPSSERSEPMPTLTILADAHHPRVPRLFDGRTVDGPHLHTAVRGHRGVAGPLVIPGRTSCLRCAHLHECDRDSAWPLLSIQWAQAPVPLADPLLVHAVAVQAVLLARSFADGSPLTDAAVEIDLGSPAAQVVARPPHALCGCRWPDPDPVGPGVR